MACVRVGGGRGVGRGECREVECEVRDGMGRGLGEFYNDQLRFRLAGSMRNSWIMGFDTAPQPRSHDQ